MRERLTVIIMALLSLGFLFGCGKSAGVLEGTWYEQAAERVDTIEIKGSTLTYRYGFTETDNVAYKGSFKLSGDGSRTRIVLDKNADFYETLYYDPDQDMITSEIFIDDYGISETIFKRTVYEAPPEPVYGERIDESDPDAPKEILWDQIASAEVSFYEFVNYKGYTINTSVLPQTGRYEYTFKVTDGEVTVSSNFCNPEVPLPGEARETIKRYAEMYSLAELNGINIHTKDVPEAIDDYTIRITYEDGTSFFSSANWKDVPADWGKFMSLSNEAVYAAFIEAGYNPDTGAYEPWVPMKRFGADPEDEEAALNIPVEEEYLKKTSETYGEYTKVTWNRFVTDDLENENLVSVLEKINKDTYDRAQKEFEEAFARLEQGMKGRRKKKDEVIFSSRWTTFIVGQADDLLVNFRIGEGSWETFLTDDPESTYKYYVLDAKTGETLTVPDLFTDPEWVADYFVEHFSHYTNESYNGYFQSEEFIRLLRGKVLEPEKYGNLDFAVRPEGLAFVMSKRIFPDSPIDLYTEVTIPYEQTQDIMNEQYVKVW